MEMSMKIMVFRFVAAICFVACPVHAMAAENANSLNKPIVSPKANPAQCYQSPKYLVVAKDAETGVGTDFLIKYKLTADEKLPCSYVFGNNDFEIKNEWAEYFAGLTDHLLILDSTTGPGPSGLTIWDLNKRKKVYKGAWSDPGDMTDASITYWAETGEATNVNCPERVEWESGGLGAAIETKVILNLVDFSVAKTKETRCDPRQ